MFIALRKFLLVFCFFLLTSMLIDIDCVAGQSTDGIYTITIDSVSSSGGITGDTMYLSQATIGQPVQGNIFSTTRAIQAGFWFASTLPPEQKKSNIFLLIIPVIISQAGQ